MKRIALFAALFPSRAANDGQASQCADSRFSQEADGPPRTAACGMSLGPEAISRPIDPSSCLAWSVATRAVRARAPGLQE